MGLIMEKAGIPFLIGAVALFVAYRVMVVKDTGWIRGKDKPEPKDKEGYCRDMGRLLLFFAAGAFVMGILEMFSETAAFVQSAVWIVILFAMWKKTTDKYY